ncbi:unnamed protein product, partial [Ectocarpus sp. 12 AP-2014]
GAQHAALLLVLRRRPRSDRPAGAASRNRPDARLRRPRSLLLPADHLCVVRHALLERQHGLGEGEGVLLVAVVVYHLLRGEPGSGQHRQDEEDVDGDQDAPEGGAVALPG